MLAVHFIPKSKVLWIGRAKLTLSRAWPRKEHLSSLYFELQPYSNQWCGQQYKSWGFVCSCPLPHLQPGTQGCAFLTCSCLSLTSLLPPAPTMPNPNIPTKAARRHFLLFLPLGVLVTPQMLTKHIYWWVQALTIPQKTAHRGKTVSHLWIQRCRFNLCFLLQVSCLSCTN